MSDLAQRLASLSPAQRQLLEKRLAKPASIEPIAIIGMACRFPGAGSLQEYWRVISEGIDATSEIPAARWDVESLYDPTGTETGKMATRWGGFVADIDLFDPVFFGITPREAARMDPQQRLLLEVAWEAMENAGRPADQMAGSKTAVFVGIGGADYAKIPAQFDDYFHHIDAHVGTGNALSIASNRVSYIFDLHGPSASVDTACSSSSLAIHLAVESLRRRECDAALAGGVNAILTPETTIAFSKARMLSPDGKCRPFDAGANGYVRGEGCALVLFKRLADAERDGDQVLAVIRATAVNQDGRTSGISAPNGQSQQACIRAALAQAGLTPEDVSYVEAHGTGTPLGDPIEMQALVEVFRRRSDNDLPMHVTSVKANIGHTETVSGVAGLIKVALLMNHDRIVPQLHLRELNPHINLQGSRITIPTAALEWAAGDRPRIAGISSFGFGGTNTHIVVEGPAATSEQPAERNGEATAAPAVERPVQLLKLSAKTDTAIRRQAEQLVEYLQQNPDANLADICYSANTGRAEFNHRASLTFATRENAASRLSALATGKPDAYIKRGQLKGLARPKVAFLFTGQGSQYVDMGRQLYDTEPLFRRELDRCDDIFHELFNESLLEVIYPGPGENELLVNETVYTQPALFAIEYALAQLWQSWGAAPDIMLGHSVGEYVAATIAGVMSLDDGLALVAHRARLMQQVTLPGKMAVVFAPESRVATALAGHEATVTVAAVNGPENTVISGVAEEVDQLVREFETAGVSVQPLTVSHAFHSPLMDDILDSFERLASEIEFHEPRLQYVSNLTGQMMSEAPTPRYWREHLRNAVRFAAGMDRIAEAQATILVEMGPTASLLGMGRRCLPEYVAAWIPSLRKGLEDWTVLAAGVGEYYVAGGRLDWRAWDRCRSRKRLLLPNYPFERSRHWLEPHDSRRRSLTSAPAVGGHPLLGVRVPSVWANAVYETTLETRRPVYLMDHQVQGSTVVPAAAFIEQGLAAAEKTFGPGQHAVENLIIQHAMFLPEGAPRRVQTSIAPESGGKAAFETHSAPLGDSDQAQWTLHAAGTLTHEHRVAKVDLPRIDLADCRRRSIDRKTRDEYYRILTERGLKYGLAFCVLDGVERSHNDACAKLALHESVLGELGKYRLHPALGDACLQTLAATVPLESDGSYSPFTYMPVAVQRVVVREPIKNLDELIYCYAVRRSEDANPSPEFVESDVFLLREDGTILVVIEGARVQRIGRGGHDVTTSATDWLYRVAWREAALDGSPKKTVSGTWLLFADQQGIAKSLTSELQSACVSVTCGESYSFGNGSAAIDPLNEEHYARLLTDACGDQPCAGVAHLWSLDIPDSADSAVWDKSRELGAGSALLLLKQLARHTFKQPPALWLVTAGAQAVDESTPLAVGQSPLVGLARVATVEQPDLKPRLIDLDPCASNATQLRNELLAQPNEIEHQIAYRNGRRYVARLERDEQMAEQLADSAAGVTVPTSGAFQLRIPKPGSFDALRYQPVQRKSPGKGQVEIEVHAAGLNFSDVLKTLGLYPGIKDAIVPLGIEASGVVIAVGEGIDRFRVGDEALGVLPYAFASHAVTADYALVKKPRSIDHEEACTIPITFLTAYYALVRLAHLQLGERVLIHAGAGGVGLAAIQIAQQIGAEIFATAGSDDKREFLWSLGVKHVYSSRSLDFAEQILTDTGREGIDVVLNSLPGEAIAKSLSILSAYGRFLEIGKIDIYQNRMVGLLPFQDNLSYFAIDLDRMLRQRPQYIRGLFAEVMQHFESGAYQPLIFTQFSADQTIAAFRYMSQRKNTGKVVVSFAACGLAPDHTASQLVRRDGAYLITGGLGALGLKVARWLADQGAGGVALMARREPIAEARAAIKDIEQRGTRVAALAADVTDAAALQTALKSLPADFPPLRGVIHAAGVLADGVLTDMSLAQLDRAMRPKVQGAWNLHAATREMPLDFFVCFSSVAAILGSPGQGNYAAGNAMLDALAHVRRRAGLPATSINWGPWADSGMAAEQGRGEGIQARGMDLLPPEQSLDLLGKLLRVGISQSVVMDVHWDALLRLLGNRRPSLLADIASRVVPDRGDSSSRVDHAFCQQLLEADAATRESLLVDFVRSELARIMGVDADQLDTQQPLAAFGLDSLMALELKNNLESRLAFTLPMAKLLEGPSIRSLAADTAEILAGNTGAESAAWQPLVELRPGTGAPLVLFPALGGDIRCYAPLVHHLAGDRPIVAFRLRGIDDNGAPHQSMNELVTDYLAALKQNQPEGPYYLSGWSAGGVAAFAMADRLRQAGEEVALVALFDTPLPSIYSGFDLHDDVRFLCDIVNFANRFAGIDMRVSYDDLAQLDPAERFPTALAEAKRQGMFPEEVSEEYVHRLVKAGEGQIKAILSYTPRPLDLPVHLFRPQIWGTLEEMSGQQLAEDLGWHSQVGQELVRHNISGDHFTMLTAGAEELAREVGCSVSSEMRQSPS